MRTHTKTFHIRFTEKEYERLCKYAEKSGLPKTTYIRHMINGCCPREHPKGDFFNFYREAYSCGTHLNQLYRMAYKFGNLQANKLAEAMKYLYAMMEKVNDAYTTLDDLDVPATLERGRQLAEEEQKEEKGGTSPWTIRIGQNTTI